MELFGFIYNGKHSDEMHLGFIPDASGRGDLVSGYSVIGADRSWAPGSDYYTTRTTTRNFELKCFYEMITRREREDILRWIDRRTSGELIFDDRPYAKYTVRPSKAPAIKDYPQFVGAESRYSGTITLYFAAHYPFAELTETDYNTASMEARIDLDLLPTAMMNAQGVVGSTTLIYNPGTELGHSIIRLAGGGTVTIKNTTNGDETKTVGAPSNYVLDSKLGSAATVSGGVRTESSSAHDKGYIHFEPNRIIRRDLQISTTSGSSTVTGYGAFTAEMAGAFIFVSNTWKKIESVTNSREIVLASGASTTATSRTTIATMNVLTVTGSTTGLSIECRPEVR